jgi:hypothetical protein
MILKTLDALGLCMDMGSPAVRAVSETAAVE